MEYAVINTGGKQYIVEKDMQLAVEKLDLEEGDSIAFEEVSLYVNGDSVDVGTPYCNIVVEGQIVEHTKDDKKKGIKYYSGGHRKKYGHKQPLTVVAIKDFKEK